MRCGARPSQHLRRPRGHPDDRFQSAQEDIDDRSKRQHKNNIQLKIKKGSDLAGDQLTYYFDICTGPNAERKSDPRLVIER
ncbi:MAG: hypothetical protein H0W08_11355 [Acidobacteria bacterium]|nr:hypothetical protein [Acidobacteriota bacterium]